jgi:hypothetical protein
MAELSPFMTILYYFLKTMCFCKSVFESIVTTPIKNFRNLIYDTRIVQVDSINLKNFNEKETIYKTNFALDALTYLCTGAKGGTDIYDVPKENKDLVFHVTFWNGFKILVRSGTNLGSIKSTRNDDILYVTLQNPNGHQKKDITHFMIEYSASFNKIAAFTVNDILHIMFALGHLTTEEYYKFYDREMSFVYYYDEITCESKYGSEIVTC